jgi:LuxR family transcriptional regulator, maltose regulon positive regulatory protein
MPSRAIVKTVLPNKIAPPEPGWFFDRPALIRMLADLSVEVRKIWVSSPGGAGKTTLVRAFLASDTRPLVWYQVDAEDRDPANLFFYLSHTLPDDKDGSKPLPQITPEYLPNFPIFCRNFFRAYFARFAHGCVLVFDDFQEAPDESFFGPVLMAAMAELPVNSNLYVLSREEPYPSLARDRLNRSLAHLSWDDLRLSSEETRRFLFWSQNEEPSPQDLDRAYNLTQGWLAGLLLFLENPAAAPLPQRFSSDRTDLLFDYFAGEIFVRLATEIQTFLLACSFLPTIDASMAEELTGKQNASEILRALIRGNYFTFRISGASKTYRFHPLFRQFLQTQAGQVLGAQRLAEIRLQAARLLVVAEQIEAAADLLIAAQDWPGLIELVSAQAEVLLRQGRTQTLLAWLKALPDELQQANPWLCYWHGCCLNAENPLEAREELTRAFELFEAGGDATGSM